MNYALVLDRSRFARLHGPRHLHVTHGTLWLTIDHEPDDHVLTRGQGIDLPAGAHALLQALDAPARACIDAPAAWWQRPLAALRGHRTRGPSAGPLPSRPAIPSGDRPRYPAGEGLT